jgi:hypothetical protein
MQFHIPSISTICYYFDGGGFFDMIITEAEMNVDGMKRLKIYNISE